LGRFWGYKIVPNLANSYQKRAAKGRQQPDNGGFSRLILLKHVKSGGSCQAVIGGVAVNGRPFPKAKQERAETDSVVGSRASTKRVEARVASLRFIEDGHGYDSIGSRKALTSAVQSLKVSPSSGFRLQLHSRGSDCGTAVPAEDQYDL
jgi:hypothetical protein